MNKAVKETLKFLNDRFSLRRDQERKDNVVAEITKGVDFSGINVWVLVFAIMIASIGLNVNSTAVVIGAMLISPLMGPIMGMGLSLGIADQQLLKKSATNLAVMVVISVLTSFLYFKISPFTEAQSELLSRTTPTIFDVFIALFGGLAGIVAAASKEKGNVVPGVAIGTALMPPLCTAGFGLAIGNWSYFFGAFYLFCINTVFICFSTLLIVRFLGFHEVDFISPERKRRVKTFVGVFVIAMVIPSIYIARTLILDSLYEKKVEQFIKTAFNFPSTEVIKYELGGNQEKRILEVSLMGEPLDLNTIVNLQHQLDNYEEMQGVKLDVKQGQKNIDASDIKLQVLEEFLTHNLDSIKSKDAQINYLKREIVSLQSQTLPMGKISKEAALFDSQIDKLCIQQATYYNKEGKAIDTIHLALTHFSEQPENKQVVRLQNWLKERIESDSVRVVIE